MARKHDRGGLITGVTAKERTGPFEVFAGPLVPLGRTDGPEFPRNHSAGSFVA